MGTGGTMSGGRAALAAASVFTGYVVLALVGISLPVGESVVTPVWAPTGIAIGAVVLLGLRAWPLVYAGSIVANSIAGAGIPIAAGIAIGNTLEAVLAAWLLARLGFPGEFARVRDVGVYLAVVLVACALAASNGAAWLALGGAADGNDAAELWLTWWLGDLTGAIIVTPVILAFAAAMRRRTRPSRRYVTEFLLTIVVIGVIAGVVWSSEELRRPAFLVPPWIWATIRFRAVGSASATLAIAIAGLAGVFYGYFTTGTMDVVDSIELVLVMLALAGLSMLGVTAVLAERDTARADLERALRTQQQVAHELRRLDEAKDRLLAAVAHELRTPLTSILGLPTLLQDRAIDADDDKSREMHERLRAEAQRLDRLLTDLLDLERLRMGMLDARADDVDVAALVRSVVARHVDDGRPTTVDVQPVRVRADPMQLERIIENLVTNACRHTPSDSALVVSVRGAGDSALISVDDEGAGVPDRDKLAIFEPFSRGTRTDEHTPGTGIGLSLVAHFSELNGGHAWVEDRPGGGSSFRVQLPATGPTTGR